MTRFTLATLAVCSLAATVSAEHRPVGIPERAKGAENVVVGTIIQVNPSFETNEFGDHLIVSHTLVRVDEWLKGKGPQVVPLDVEGGTVGTLTLHVSDLEPVATGDRGVFFTDTNKAGKNVPHLRGLGIIKVDKSDKVPQSSLTLEDLKQLVRQGQ